MRKSIEEMIRLANAGGGCRLSWRHYSLEELIRIANAAKGHRATLIVTDAEGAEIEQLIRVANAGGGCVLFDSGAID